MSWETDAKYILRMLDDFDRRLQFQERLESGGVGKDGWLEIPDGLATYSSTTRINLADANLVLSKGDQIRYKQGGGYKYGSVYADPTSTYVDVTGGTDYSVANATITDFAFSKGGGVGFPGQFDWSTGVNAQGFSSLSTEVSKFSISGNVVSVYMNINGTSNATSFNATMPIAAKYSTEEVVHIKNAGTPAFGRAVITGAMLSLFVNAEGGSWAASGEKELTKALFRYFI